ncbi:hypothetical protein Taro_008964 [Colocasia esculenta]|uniref:Uncharacterized protein n=1 Tax=Colocasia esculenta TaxID=4460 RepID=A0A843U4I7_COLES|nr:hypothetical protein [Colocasia esculenta]
MVSPYESRRFLTFLWNLSRVLDPPFHPRFRARVCVFCTDLSRRQGPWTPSSPLASIDRAADSESAARDRRLVRQDRTVSCSVPLIRIVGDSVPSEETTETDSERGD